MEIKNNFIVTCEYAFLSAGTNNLNLIGVFTAINADRFPFVHRKFDLVTNFDMDAPGPHTLHTLVLDGEDVELLTSKVNIQVNSTTYQVITHFENLSFPKPGKYELRVAIDDIYVGSRFLIVNPVVQQQKENFA